QEDQLHDVAPVSLAGRQARSGLRCPNGVAVKAKSCPHPCPLPQAGEGNRSPLCREDANSSVVVVGVRDQRKETGALDRGRQLALVLGLGPGHAARHDLAGLGEVLAQGVEILVIDLLDALGGELAELAAAKELGHGNSAPGIRDQAVSAVSSAGLASASSALASLRSSSRRGRSPRSPRSPRSGLSPFSSLNFMISDCSVSASSRRMTR